MCGIAGFCNFRENLSKYQKVLTDMTNLLEKRGPDEKGYFTNDSVFLGQRRLIVIDPEVGKQPMTFTYNENSYTIVYNGQIYNTDELKETLLDNRLFS